MMLITDAEENLLLKLVEGRIPLDEGELDELWGLATRLDAQRMIRADPFVESAALPWN